MRREGVLEVLHQDGAFVAAPVAVAQGRDEAPRVDVEEQLGLAVDVDFDVLVAELFEFEGDPDSVDEGAGNMAGSAGALGLEGGFVFAVLVPSMISRMDVYLSRVLLWL